ncbi:hypothetical protein BST61_g11157 [Cercospora zeina]
MDIKTSVGECARGAATQGTFDARNTALGVQGGMIISEEFSVQARMVARHLSAQSRRNQRPLLLCIFK